MKKYTCKCGTKLTLGKHNTKAVIFMDEPHYSHLRISCWKCKVSVRMFFKEELMDDMLDQKFGAEYLRFASIELKEMWLQVYADEPEYIEEVISTDDKIDIGLRSQFHQWLENVNPEDFT